MFKISKIGPKSLLGPVKSQKFSRCLDYHSWNPNYLSKMAMIAVCHNWNSNYFPKRQWQQSDRFGQNFSVKRSRNAFPVCPLLGLHNQTRRELKICPIYSWFDNCDVTCSAGLQKIAARDIAGLGGLADTFTIMKLTWILPVHFWYLVINLINFKKRCPWLTRNLKIRVSYGVSFLNTYSEQNIYLIQIVFLSCYFTTFSAVDKP